MNQKKAKSEDLFYISGLNHTGRGKKIDIGDYWNGSHIVSRYSTTHSLNVDEGGRLVVSSNTLDLKRRNKKFGYQMGYTEQETGIDEIVAIVSERSPEGVQVMIETAEARLDWVKELIMGRIETREELDRLTGDTRF